MAETIEKSQRVTKADGESIVIEYTSDPERYDGIRVYVKGTTYYYPESQMARMLDSMKVQGATITTL